MRNDIKNIVGELSSTHPIPWDFDVMECYKLIFDYCKHTKTQPRKNTYSAVNGVLIINNTPIERVAVYTPYAPKTRQICGDYEAAILSRQEAEQ